MHTHTTETFMTEDKDYYTEDFKSRTTDNSKNMAAVGKVVEQKLNKAGIKTIHITTQHDYPNYTGSYDRAAQTIINCLKKLLIRFTQKLRFDMIIKIILNIKVFLG